MTATIARKRDEDEADRIGCRHVVEQRLDELRDAERGDDAGDDADCGEHDALPDHQPQNIAPCAAPSAMRTPISWRRCETEYDSTP